MIKAMKRNEINKILPTITAITIAIVIVVGVIYVFMTKSESWPLAKNTGPSPEVEPAAVVKLVVHPSLGNYLTDSMGYTLYVYGKDKPLESLCENECARIWAPYLADSGEFRQNGNDSDLLTKRTSIIQRTDGSYQYAYEEKPLYRYGQDSQPGDINGNNFSGLWSIIPVE